jgi:peptidoglycan hydrolase-like protein with peptidoglycan-binding domain
MKKLIQKSVPGAVSVLALGIGTAALDAASNSGAEAGNTANAAAMPAASQPSDILGTDDSFRKDDIRWAQVELRFRGFYKGSLDGVLGPKTKLALVQFQRNRGLNRTASLDAQTWEALTSSPGIAQGSSMPPENDSSGSMTNSSPVSDWADKIRRAALSSTHEQPTSTGLTALAFKRWRDRSLVEAPITAREGNKTTESSGDSFSPS